MEQFEIMKENGWLFLADYIGGIRIYINTKTFNMIIQDTKEDKFVKLDNEFLERLSAYANTLVIDKLKNKITTQDCIINEILREDLGKITINNKNQ